MLCQPLHQDPRAACFPRFPRCRPSRFQTVHLRKTRAGASGDASLFLGAVKRTRFALSCLATGPRAVVAPGQPIVTSVGWMVVPSLVAIMSVDPRVFRGRDGRFSAARSGTVATYYATSEAVDNDPVGECRGKYFTGTGCFEQARAAGSPPKPTSFKRKEACIDGGEFVPLDQACGRAGPLPWRGSRLTRNDSPAQTKH